jgi:thymidylate kinase
MNSREMSEISGIQVEVFPPLPTCEPVVRRSRPEFLRTLFRTLEDHQVRYCVLHSWEELPDVLTSDLDIAVHPEDVSRLPHVFWSLQNRGYTAVQTLNYFVNAYYFVFFWLDGEAIASAAIDVILEHRRGGLIEPSGESLVLNRQRPNAFWIPAPETEFLYLLGKKTWKRSVPANQAIRLKSLVQQLGVLAAERLSSRLFLGKLSSQVVEACTNGSIDALLRKVKGQTWATSLRRTPWKLTKYIFLDVLRRTRRWMQPTGLFVVVRGPDGVGKSTVIGHVLPMVSPAFRRYRLFHWRPNLLLRRTAPTDTSRPHSCPPRASWWSVAKLLGYVLDYWAGYLLVIRPLLAKSTLVVFDRYFDDILIDAKRYRYGGPLWVARILYLLIPKPDMVLTLDAPPEVVLGRKQEVTLQEVRRQRLLYCESRTGNSKHCVLDASAATEHVATDAARTIFDYLACRFKRQHTRWLVQSFD